MSKNYFLAVATLFGAITGAGFFAVPYAIAHAGAATFLVYLPILLVIQIFLHLLFARLILSTKTKHRLPGYVEIYAGKKYKSAVSFFSLISGYGTLLAYVILGGIFLFGLLAPHFGGSLVFYSLVLFTIEGLIVLADIKMISGAELILNGFLIIVVVIIAAKSFFHLELSNFLTLDWHQILLPYGPIFFAVGGDAAIPEVCRLLSKEKQNIKGAIIWGTILPAVVLFVFVLTVVGVTGAHTTADTLSGLRSAFSDGVITWALIFGVLNIFTSTLVMMQAVREIYWWDFKINKNLSWVFVFVLPIILYLFNFTNLTAVISITGAVMGGILGVVLVLLFPIMEKKPEQHSVLRTSISRPWAIALCSVFVAGLISELIKWIF
ncbi:MAG TPA: aromatic amino acid transport family protein [Candidatus Nanoarchaeia archaeon]|nr:aromatic amino acid transport family protein [Candidatus Nanoarchaeia archaeon]